MRQSRHPLVPEVIHDQQVLTLGRSNTIREEWPTGVGGWITLWLLFKFTLVVGTGTGAISEGILKIIRNLNFEAGADGETHDAPGRGLYKVGHAKFYREPLKEEIAAADGTYSVMIPLLFANPNFGRPFDTILDAERYDGVELKIDMGTVADVLTTPGTAALTASVTTILEKTFDELPPQLKPKALPFYKALPPVDPDLKDFVELDRSDDLRIHELLLMTANSVTATEPFTGTPADNVVSEIGLIDGHGDIIKKTPRQLYQQQLRERILDTLPTGIFHVNLIRDGSYFSGIDTNHNVMTKLRSTFKKDTTSTSGVSVMEIGSRSFKESDGGV